VERARTIKRRAIPAGRLASVSTATDTFASFVDALASSLDDHGVPGEDLAASVFTS
jgi:hypothetical protein